MELAVAIFISIISSTAISSLVIFFINRRDNKKNELRLILDKLDKLELDSTRTQLLFLIYSRNENTSEILSVAEHYFNDLNGDWYMSAVFEHWLGEKDLVVPTWYKK